MRKFMFERSFDMAGGRIAPREKPPVTLAYDQLEKLKKEAHEAGFAAGKAAAGEEQTAHIKATVAQIDARIGQLLADAAAARTAEEPLLREAVLALARKILPDFARRNGLEEIKAIVAGVVGEMSGEPRLAMRVNDTQFDAIDASVKEITAKQGFTGKVVLMADAAVAPDDCLIEWADGGIARNVEALWQSIARTIAPGAEMPPKPAAADTETAEEPESETPPATAEAAPATPEIPPEEANHG